MFRIGNGRTGSLRFIVIDDSTVQVRRAAEVVQAIEQGLEAWKTKVPAKATIHY